MNLEEELDQVEGYWKQRNEVIGFMLQGYGTRFFFYNFNGKQTFIGFMES